MLLLSLFVRKCWLSYGLVVLILLFLLPLGRAADLTVTTTTDVVNGDVSSPQALEADPGPDGISLREAVLSVNNAVGPHTITFAATLAGQTINITSPLFITRDGITLTGLSTPDGQPNITLDAGGITEDVCSRALLFVHASDFTITWFRVTRVTVTGIRIQAGQSFCTAPPPQVSNIRIEHNVFDNTGLDLTEFGKAIWVMTDPEGLATDARITNVTVARNSFLHYTPWPFGLGILVGPAGRNCAIQDVVIHANTFADTLGGVEFSTTTGSGNRIVGTQITENTFRNGIVPVFIGNLQERPDAPPASGNIIDDTVVRDNIIFGEWGSITILGGQTYARANVVRDVEIINNLIVTGSGINIAGGKWGATGNRVELIRITNNSIVTHPQAGVRVFSDYEDGTENSVTGVSVLNTIFQKREPDTLRPEDVIAGEITPDQVRFSIISTPGFVGVNGNFSADPKFVNPNFVNPEEGDFHLQPGSLAIDAGTSDGAPSTDLEGRTRFDDPSTPNTGGGAIPYYDIGAFEYGSPPTVLFSDVPSGYWAYDYIIAIYNDGITQGCAQDDPNTPENERRYCPEDSVTRGQMAAFIIRAKYGETFSYTTTPYFTDVPSTHTFFKYVQKLKDDGITAVSGTYGVDNEVTRGQMAAFIIRAKFGENFSYTTTPYFSDVPSTHTFFKYVQKLKDEGITTVTGIYGVDNIVTRAPMAAFLARAFLGMN